ncbi:hypothetical protein ECRM12761_2415 [Escherichia coli O145:H28 str. RM12761]|jgi:hypothetical protein|uniref:Uncharacterized protein n=1 Tax=Escherichia coli O145:H28 (strain RM12581) TaxID=1248823 RepID=A0ABC7ZM83_ECOLR|nr:hypothetical protein ECRM13514_0334 [Escherichia coli O145:H28 str. RM13514]AHG13179.1 hypothetical protein ECRM13516_0491 [Escherichia coli O145:H28 str. RM13516]AHY63520.1 hypothetical protein ECRM12761_2415 [Escherichia coli O145:H28 str. RM12761]AHY68855.1 hypothetical protein ECRM12581_1625 [Escherichia coli O145:H28 str. RM12581]
MNSVHFGNKSETNCHVGFLKAEGGKPSALATFPQLFNKLTDQFQQRD